MPPLRSDILLCPGESRRKWGLYQDLACCENSAISSMAKARIRVPKIWIRRGFPRAAMAISESPSLPLIFLGPCGLIAKPERRSPLRAGFLPTLPFRILRILPGRWLDPEYVHSRTCPDRAAGGSTRRRPSRGQRGNDLARFGLGADGGSGRGAFNGLVGGRTLLRR